MIRWFSLLLLLASCASNQKVFHGNTNRTELFPVGTYRHLVEISSEKMSNRFQGVIRIEKERVVVAGLGPLGTTLFRITEDRTKKDIKIEVFQDALQKHQEKILEFYTVLREIFLLPASTPDRKTIKGKGYDVELKFEKWDANRIPEKFSLRHPGFNVSVVVEAYDV